MALDTVPTLYFPEEERATEPLVQRESAPRLSPMLIEYLEWRAGPGDSLPKAARQHEGEAVMWAEEASQLSMRHVIRRSGRWLGSVTLRL
jgi:hypothetical protein